MIEPGETGPQAPDDAALFARVIGFYHRTLGLRLLKKKLKAGRELRDRLQAVGMLRASGH